MDRVRLASHKDVRFDSVAVAEPFLVGGTRFFPSKKAAIVAVYNGFWAFGVHSKL